jgi:thiol-disulfide isomerase/thioredoxin
MDYNEKYLKYKNKYLELKKIINSNNMIGGSSSDTTMYLFKADWCGHCKNLAPVWDQLQKEVTNIKFVTYDSQKDKNSIEKYNISGFPTIILKKNDKAYDYGGARDLNSLKDFINSYN